MNYEIIVKNGTLHELGDLVKTAANGKITALVTDSNVAPLYEKTAKNSLTAAGFAVISHTIPAGEKSKNSAQFFELQNWLAENQVTRSDVLIALGGGVVGDLTGFVAATYLRGVRFVQVPTTLLAMVDSSVGGKTGIDIPAGKNLVGAFHQPSLVVCDPTVLKTLPKEVFNDGCAEVIKHGMIRSRGLLENMEISSDVIQQNIAIKREIVKRDEFDTGERQLLNFGHTIGHAIEKLSGFTVSHGQAVAIGMCIITRAAAKKGLCPGECSEILERLAEKCGLPNKTDFSPEEIYQAALGDKKRMGDTITEIIPREVGFCELIKMPVSELLDWIKMGMSV